MAPPLLRSLDSLKRYFNDPLHSDITICFSGRKIYAHKMILVLSSSYFRTALEGHFIVRQAEPKEANLPQLELFDDDADAPDGMLRYFYGRIPHSAVRQPGIYFDLKLFAVAGKYDVPCLLEEIVIKVKTYLRGAWNDSAFSQIIFDIYETTPAHSGELRQVATEVCRSNFVPLMAKKRFKEVLLEVPELCVDIMKVLADDERKQAAKSTT